MKPPANESRLKSAAPFLSSVNLNSLWSARQLRTLNRLRARALGDLAIGIDASLSGEIDGPVCSV